MTRPSRAALGAHIVNAYVDGFLFGGCVDGDPDDDFHLQRAACVLRNECWWMCVPTRDEPEPVAGEIPWR